MTDWSEVEILDENPGKVNNPPYAEKQNGHELILVVRVAEDGSHKKRSGYDADGRYTRVDNVTYKCKKCGVETGTTPYASSDCRQ